MAILKINKLNEIELDTPSVLAIAAFKKLIVRCANERKDVQKEFMYVYYIADVNSPGNVKGLNDKHLHIEAVKEIGLDAEWQPDDIIKAAILAYKEHSRSIGMNIVQALRRTFANTAEIVEIVNTTIITKLKELTALKATTTLEEGQDANQLINDLLSLQKRLVDIGKEVPKTISQLEEQEQLLTKEQEKKETALGDGEITYSMLPH